MKASQKGELQAKSNEDLMEAYKKDDAMAFEILYERHSAQVLGYLKQKTRSVKQAQDLSQEVFLKLHRSRHLYNSMLPFTPWLFSITRSVFLDSLKKKSLEDLVENQDFDKITPVQESVELNAVDLSVLPEAQQQVVRLRVYDEATFEEIAAKLSTTPENARQIFSRAVKALKIILGEGRSK